MYLTGLESLRAVHITIPALSDTEQRTIYKHVQDFSEFSKTTVCFTRLQIYIAGVAPASSFIISNSVPMYQSMYVCPQGPLVRRSCRPPQTKNGLSVTLCLAGQRDFGCHEMDLPPYCANVMQHIIYNNNNNL